MLKFLVIVAVLFSLVATAWPQELRSYYITCDPDEFTYLLAHPQGNSPISCSLEYESQQWSDLELSLRDGPYLNEPKKSFRLNFDDQFPFYGRDRMVLSAQWNDPTFSREYLAYDLFDRAGLYAPQAWFARIYVNGVYLGLYLDIEEIDSNFLLRTGLSPDASIYRADEPGCFLAIDEQLENTWLKITNPSTGYYDLADVILWLDTVHEEFFYEQIQERFDLPELLSTIAINALIGNRATYYDHYALIHDLNASGIWQFLPWETDSCFVYGFEYNDPDYFSSGHPEMEQTNVLIEKCWRHRDTQPLILEQLGSLIETLFTEVYYQQISDSLLSLLTEAVEEDTAKQFSVNDFLEGLADLPGNVAGRAASLTTRMEHEPLPFNLNPMLLSPNGIYFSWDRTQIADGEPVTYVIEISENVTFSTILTEFNTGSANSYLTSDLLPGNYYWRVLAYSPTAQGTRSLAFFSPVNLPGGAFEGTVWTDPITESVTWTVEDSPYRLPEGLMINAGATLTIDPGVSVGIGSGQHIFVNGGLNAIGTESDSIHFVPLDPDSTWGALFADTPTGDINLIYSSLIGGSNIDSGQGTPAVIKIGYGELNIYDSHIRQCAHAALAAAYTNVHLERVNFDYFDIRPVIVLAGSGIIRSCNFSHSSATLGVGLCEINAIDSYSEVSNCQFYGCSDDALDLDFTHAPVTISRNIITGAEDKGISIGTECTEVNISNCVITECDIGVGIYSSSNATIYNTVISQNREGITLSHPGGGAETTARNTVVWGNDEDVIAPFGTNLTMEYCLTGGTTPYPGPGNLNEDPAFVDPWNNNHFPLENSPLIDAGFGTGAPDQDLIHSIRVDIPTIPNTGSGEVEYVDIGIFEFHEELYPGVEPDPIAPEYFHILECFPNPFNNSTRINFKVQQPGWADIQIFDLLGRPVFQRRFRELPQGNHSVIWNGNNSLNHPLGSGIYLCRLATEHNIQTIKMVLMK